MLGTEPKDLYMLGNWSTTFYICSPKIFFLNKITSLLQPTMCKNNYIHQSPGDINLYGNRKFYLTSVSLFNQNNKYLLTLCYISSPKQKQTLNCEGCTTVQLWISPPYPQKILSRPSGCLKL